MSAFYDIWIGNPKPVATRLDNEAWKSGNIGAAPCYLSLPQGQGEKFIRQVRHAGYTMIVLGQFYEPIEDVALLVKCISYINDNDNQFNDPAGHYILFLLDDETGDCHVFTNRFGTYHAYWMSNGGTNAISTYYKALTQQAKDKNLDWEGIAGFFAMGYFPGDKTYLGNIKILMPASYYRFNSTMNMVVSKRYWNWRQPSQHRFNTVDALHQVREAIMQSINVSLKQHKVALPISGGLDSRMLAGLVTDTNEYSSLWGYSYGYKKKSTETTIASRIAQVCNIPFERFVVPDYMFGEIDTISQSVECFQYLDGTRQACMRPLLAQRSDVVVGGHWGDVWMDSAQVTSDMLPAFFEKKILKRGRHWLLSEICSGHLPNASQYLKEYFTEAINSYSDVEDTHRFKAYKTDAWSFRWTLASIRMYQAATFPVLPFYDKNVADILWQVTGDELAGRKFQIEFIKYFQPRLAEITWQEYGRNLYSYKSFNNRNLLYRALRKTGNILTQAKPIIRNWEIFYLGENGRKNLSQHLLGNTLLESFVSEKKIESLIHEFYRQPNAANGYTISMLLTFSVALKNIFE